MRQMRDQGVQAVMMSGDGITSDEFATIGGDGVVGTLMTFAPGPAEAPEAAEVVEKFRKKNFKPEAYTLYSYAAVQVIAQAAAEAQVARPQEGRRGHALGQEVQDRDRRARLRQEGRHRTTVDYVMYTWKKGADGKITYSQN